MSANRETAPQPVSIGTEYIKLDQLLKFSGAVLSGGEAKERIAEGEVLVNGEICQIRGKKLRAGDRVSFAGETYLLMPEE